MGSGIGISRRSALGPGGRTGARLGVALGVALLAAACSSSAATFPPTQTPAATPAVTTVGTEAATTLAPATQAATPAPAPATPTTPAAGNSIVFSPSTFSCSDAKAPLTITWTMAAGTSGDLQILYEWDGSLGQGGQAPRAVSAAGFSKQSDGSWQQTESTTGADLCSNLGLTSGSHTWTVVQAQSDGTPGKLVAQGSFTVTP
jgi:hypothetical protein